MSLRALLAAPPEASPAQVRGRALVKLGVGAALVPIAFLLSRFLRAHFIGHGVTVLPALVLLPLGVALLELVAGVGFLDLASRWDSLAGWQRGVIGTLVALASLGLFAGGALAYLSLHAN